MRILEITNIRILYMLVKQDVVQKDNVTLLLQGIVYRHIDFVHKVSCFAEVF